MFSHVNGTVVRDNETPRGSFRTVRKHVANGSRNGISLSLRVLLFSSCRIPAMSEF